MSRFDASEPAERRSLVADAIAAHRERDSQFCTLEADAPPAASRGPEPADDAAEDPEAIAATEQPAWVQFSEREGVLNLDCTDREYDRLTDVLADFPEFTVEAQESPEDADARNLRIAARADAERIAELVERCFLEGFDYDRDFRLWATEV